MSKLNEILEAIEIEVNEAEKRYPPMNSAHEAYAVLLEEVDELWAEVKKNPKRRDPQAMYTEAIQVAAMAVRLIKDCIELEKE